jgi:hypothetical protein
MAEGLILEFAGSTLATYRAVSEKLGMDTTNPKADWPAGLRFHAAGSTGAGFLVFEVWDSRDAQDRFMQTRLGPALQAGGSPQPTRMEWITLAAHTIPAA